MGDNNGNRYIEEHLEPNVMLRLHIWQEGLRFVWRISLSLERDGPPKQILCKQNLRLPFQHLGWTDNFQFFISVSIFVFQSETQFIFSPYKLP